jgi:hypothetical protein
MQVTSEPRDVCFQLTNDVRPLDHMKANPWNRTMEKKDVQLGKDSELMMLLDRNLVKLSGDDGFHRFESS